MVSQPPKHSRTAVAKSRAQVVKPGRLPVTEFAFDRAGAASPFGDDVTFPLPVDALTYEHPARADEQAEPE
jgi:succinate dehydrogenase / fumarate reductase iron-sulfur subunit